MFGARLPAPRKFLLLIIFGALEAHFFEIVLQRAVRLGIGQYLQVDHYVHVHGAVMRRYDGWPCGNQIPRCKATDEIDRILPWPQPAQQGHQDAFTIDRVLVAVAVEGCGFGHQKPILSLRKCSAISLARPSPRSKSR